MDRFDFREEGNGGRAGRKQAECRMNVCDS